MGGAAAAHDLQSIDYPTADGEKREKVKSYILTS